MDRNRSLYILLVAALLGSAIVADDAGLGLVKRTSTIIAARKDRDDDDPDDKSSGSSDDDAAPVADDAPTEPDLNHPSVLAAIEKAVTTATSEAEEAKDKEWQAHKDNHDKLLGQHKEMKDRLSAIELAQQAKDAGVDEEKYSAQVESAAQAKYDARKGELDELLKTANDRADKAEARVSELEARELDAWLEAELVRASIPEDVPQFVQIGAWPDLKRRVKPLVERYQPDPEVPAVARVKQNGSIVPGDGPSGHMTLRELITKARLGKGPLENIAYFFVSSGRGSGTKSNAGALPRTMKWSEMDPAEKAAFTDEHGLEATRAAIETEYPMT